MPVSVFSPFSVQKWTTVDFVLSNFEDSRILRHKHLDLGRFAQDLICSSFSCSCAREVNTYLRWWNLWHFSFLCSSEIAIPGTHLRWWNLWHFSFMWHFQNQNNPMNQEICRWIGLRSDDVTKLFNEFVCEWKKTVKVFEQKKVLVFAVHKCSRVTRR